MEYHFKRFVTDMRPKIIAENPEFNFVGMLGKIDRELEAQWAKHSDAEKRTLDKWCLRERGWT